jgi:hypothetical protein
MTNSQQPRFGGAEGKIRLEEMGLKRAKVDLAMRAAVNNFDLTLEYLTTISLSIQSKQI